MIVFKKVHKQYRVGTEKRVVFENLSLEMPTNRRLAVLGAPESGKSVIGRMICGLEAPNSGTIIRSAKVSYPVGYARAMKPNLSVAQNISFAARVYGCDPAEVLDFTARVTGLAAIFDELFRKLTNNDRATLSFALSFALQFDTYIFDNFVAYGNPRFRQICIAMYEQRMTHSGSIILTKNAKTARRLCDCAMVLDQGSFTFYEDIEDAIFAYEQLEHTRLNILESEAAAEEAGDYEDAGSMAD